MKPDSVKTAKAFGCDVKTAKWLYDGRTTLGLKSVGRLGPERCQFAWPMSEKDRMKGYCGWTLDGKRAGWPEIIAAAERSA